MDLNNIFNIVQIIIAVLLTVAILLQQRGTGLGGAFGGEGGVYYKKRGLEKLFSPEQLSLLYCSS